MTGAELRATAYAVLDGRHGRFGIPYAWFTNITILVAVLGDALKTMPNLPEYLRAALQVSEALVIAIFATDYVLRLSCAPLPWRYATSFWGIVDLVAFAPALLLAGTDLSSARMLRLIQVARLLKLMRLTHAFDNLFGALSDVRDQLIVFIFLTLIVLFLASVGIYHFEYSAQPDVFKSVPHALWWAVATLSTVGYGDIYPITPGGRFFTGIVLLIGLAVIAVPTGLISASLVSRLEEDRRKKEREEEARSIRKRSL